jgi:predicted dehydrogenase
MTISSNPEKLKVGVVGLGKMGIMHACLLNTFPNVDVAALCDKSRLIRIVAKRAMPNATVTDELEEFSKLSLDAIFVLTPIPSHYPILKEIYVRDLAPNVFVEKTLSATHKKSEELCNLSQKNGGVNMVGYMKRFAVTFNQAKTLLQQGVLGDLISFDAYGFSADFSEVPEGSEISKARGGALEDLGSHVVDVALWLLGGLQVTSAGVNSRIASDSEDDVFFNVAGADGLVGKFEVSWRKIGYRMPEFGLTLKGTKGSLSVNDDQLKLQLSDMEPKRFYRHDLGDNVGFFLGGSEYYREDMHFVEAALAGKAAISDFQSAIKVDYLIEQVRRQLK